jgi:hypothetical protein
VRKMAAWATNHPLIDSSAWTAWRLSRLNTRQKPAKMAVDKLALATGQYRVKLA